MSDKCPLLHRISTALSTKDYPSNFAHQSKQKKSGTLPMHPKTILQPSSITSTTEMVRTQTKRIDIADSSTLNTTGYLYNKPYNGTVLINKKSSFNVPTTAHETMYTNYCARMTGHLQATIRHMRAFNFLLKKIRGIKTARVCLMIARDGSLLQAEIITSCGLTELDALIMEAIKTAHPYPPLPNYFPSNTFIYDSWFSLQGLK